jgi:hypothetical protein
MRLLTYSESKHGVPEILVAVRDFDCSDLKSHYDNRMSVLPRRSPYKCIIEIDSAVLDDCRNGSCANATAGEFSVGFRAAMEAERLLRSRCELKRLPKRLESYWQNGIDRHGLDILTSVGFIHDYTSSLCLSILGNFLLSPATALSSTRPKMKQVALTIRTSRHFCC